MKKKVKMSHSCRLRNSKALNILWSGCACEVGNTPCNVFWMWRGDRQRQAPSIAFRHHPPNYARFSYATEGALFISAQLSTDEVSALRKVRVLIRLGGSLVPKHARKHEAHPPRVKKRRRVPSRLKRFWFYLSWRKEHGEL